MFVGNNIVGVYDERIIYDTKQDIAEIRVLREQIMKMLEELIEQKKLEYKNLGKANE